MFIKTLLHIMYLVIAGGSLFLFDRKVLRYFRKDGHNWRKKKDGKTVKEAHEKLKASMKFSPFSFWLIKSLKDKHVYKIIQIISAYFSLIEN